MVRKLINRLANFVIKLILRADKEHLSDLYNKTLASNAKMRYENYRKRYTIANSFRFNGYSIRFYGNGDIICGENSYIGEYSTLQVSEGYKINIGSNCSISHNVRMYTSSNVANQDFNSNEKETEYGDIIIDDAVWIGVNVFIKQGVHIGENSVIAANSVVNKNVPPNSIFGGVPAKLIKQKSLRSL